MKTLNQKINQAEIRTKAWARGLSVWFPFTKILEGRDSVREKIREHFNYTCQSCGEIWQNNERRFDVHHFGEGHNKTKSYDKNWKEDINNGDIGLFCHCCHLNLPE